MAYDWTNHGVAKDVKKSFPTNIVVSLLIGLILGYFAATYIMGGASGRAFESGNNVCTAGATECVGNAIQRCIDTPKGTTWLFPAPDCTKLTGDFICRDGRCVKP